MTRITVDEAGSRLRELISKLQPGEELQITDGERAVARLVAESPRSCGSS